MTPLVTALAGPDWPLIASVATIKKTNRLKRFPKVICIPAGPTGLDVIIAKMRRQNPRA